MSVFLGPWGKAARIEACAKFGHCSVTWGGGGEVMFFTFDLAFPCAVCSPWPHQAAQLHHGVGALGCPCLGNGIPNPIDRLRLTTGL